ncbi:hypothetical protein Taro_004135 [Colocasia esculenta]|uniref:Uncharacterized protein n=1 Tax=Colocasia esculenta TaxID=4460 RepID=A0A843TNN9_COLES|nr:hypothetical protein [Colocasia esculenta]
MKFKLNIVNVTVELSSFGRPKKEKLEPHLRPLREATAPTQPSQPGSQPSQPTIHHRQRETSDVREHPEDIHRRQRGHGREAKRIVHSLFSGDHSGTTVLPRFLCIQVGGQRSCRRSR